MIREKWLAWRVSCEILLLWLMILSLGLVYSREECAMRTCVVTCMGVVGKL